MKRLHVHVAVDQLTTSIAFYEAMFGAPPTVRKPDYAKWMLEDPRVNFAISQRGATPGLDHLGIQVESAEELAEMQARLATLATPITSEAATTCCYAKADKHWVTDAQGIAWETFHTLDSAPTFGADARTVAANAGSIGAAASCATDASCCAPRQGVAPSAAAPATKSCC
ncbi:MAG: VOC family protein [Myxococcales bacterium]|nr:VOC family protein [Myxococcales bacterium]